MRSQLCHRYCSFHPWVEGTEIWILTWLVWHCYRFATLAERNKAGIKSAVGSCTLSWRGGMYRCVVVLPSNSFSCFYRYVKFWIICWLWTFAMDTVVPSVVPWANAEKPLMLARPCPKKDNADTLASIQYEICYSCFKGNIFVIYLLMNPGYWVVRADP